MANGGLLLGRYGGQYHVQLISYSTKGICTKNHDQLSADISNKQWRLELSFELDPYDGQSGGHGRERPLLYLGLSEKPSGALSPFQLKQCKFWFFSLYLVGVIYTFISSVFIVVKQHTYYNVYGCTISIRNAHSKYCPL